MLVRHKKLCTITKYSHFFSITDIDPTLHKHIMDFCLNFVIRTLVRVDPKKPPVMKITTIFASRLKNGSEYRLHIGQLDLLLNFLKFRYIETDLIEIIEKPLYNLITINNTKKDKWVLRKEQQEAEDFILQSSSDDNHSRLLTMPTGTGKAQPLDAPIKIPGGWTTMGKIKVGDTITAWDGKPTMVNGVFPQGIKDIYRITFSDGRTAECCEDHLWKIYRNFWRGEKWKVVDTKELLRIKELTTDNIYIPLIKPEQGEDIELPFDPYLLGIILGNGDLTNRSLRFSIQDEFLLYYIIQFLPDGFWIKGENDYDYIIHQHKSKDNGHSYLSKLEKFGLTEIYSYEKFIPNIYFNGSLTQRLSILKGLLDTVGVVNSNGDISFYSTSLDLANNVQELVRSIGGIAELITYSDKYQVSIKYSKPNEIITPSIIKNKGNNLNEYYSGFRLRINNIEKIGRKEAQCISIDHPDKLYVTNDYVVTHNTVTALSAASKFKNRVMIIVLAKYLEKWLSDVSDEEKGVIDIDKSQVLTIQGSDNLRSSINLAKDNQFNYNYVILSLTTIVNFIKSFENNYYESLDEFGIDPSELCELFNIGVVIFDEAHEHLFSIFKTLSFTNVPKVIALSATFIAQDSVIDRMQSIMFPKEIRFNKIQMKKYIKVTAVSYQISDINKANIRTSEFRSITYSHTAFEKSLMRNLTKLRNYFNMIKDLINTLYIKEYIKGDKLLIFCSTIKLCNKLKDYLKNVFTGYDIRTYIESDPYVNILESDIIVSTLKSSGTALDIPNLRVCIKTVNVDSPITNLQALGRLRELKDRDVKYCYIYCSNIPKHVKYHHRRKELYKDKVLYISDMQYPQPI